MRPSELFWDFSVRTYRTPGVPDACLSLQNERGADVNLLLFCCWVGATRGVFEDRLFEVALDFSMGWANRVVRGLREVRTWMKQEGCLDERVPAAACMSLRERIKACEFEAEKMQQEVLESFSAGKPVSSLQPAAQIASIAANLRRYFLAMQIEFDEWAIERLATIVKAGLQHPDEYEVTIALRRGGKA